MQLEKEPAAERALIEAHELQEHEERRVEAKTKKKEAKEIEDQVHFPYALPVFAALFILQDLLLSKHKSLLLFLKIMRNYRK